MVPNLHPEQAKALYREVANDRAPAPAPASKPVPATRSKHRPYMSREDENFWFTVVGACVLGLAVAAIAFVKSFA